MVFEQIHQYIRFRQHINSIDKKTFPLLFVSTKTSTERLWKVTKFPSAWHSTMKENNHKNQRLQRATDKGNILWRIEMKKFAQQNRKSYISFWMFSFCFVAAVVTITQPNRKEIRNNSQRQKKKVKKNPVFYESKQKSLTNKA